MARDASLDDFAVGGDDGEDGDDVDDAPDADGSASDDVASEDGGTEVDAESDDAEAVAVREPSSVDPAVETSTLASDGAACAACGASARRLWTADGERVCADCKPW